MSRSFGLALLTSLTLLCPGLAAAAGPPQIAAAWVTDVTATSAVLRAEINPDGLSTKYQFEYLTEAAYQANLQAGHDGFLGARLAPANGSGIGSGNAPVGVSTSLSPPSNPLTPDTAYSYRALASNQAGPVSGDSRLLRTQQSSTPTGLPDSRAYELVSPLDKGGGSIAAPGALFGGGEIQAAAAGGGLTFGSATAFGEALGAPPVSQYLSRRGATGWSTENLSAPLDSSVYGDHPDGAPYRLFSADLGLGLLAGGEPCRGRSGCPSPAAPLADSGAPGAYPTYYLRSTAAEYVSLLTASDLTHTSLSPEDFKITLAGATPDLSHIVLSSCAKLTSDAREAPNCSAQNLYEWSGGELEAINLLPAEREATPGALLAAPIGAISEDGSRVYMYQLEDGPIYLREGPESKAIPGTTGELSAFEAASADGSFAYLLKSGHLDRYDAQTEALTDLTPSGGVIGVLGTSIDGSRVYFQDGAGLELWNLGQTTLVAAGPAAAAPSDYPPASATVRISTDGTRLAFLSDQALGAFDNTDAETGEPDTELFLYDERTGGLTCASCNPTGERPRGSATIPGALLNATTQAYRPRALSADGRRVFFDSSDRLLVNDTDSATDVYQWEAAGEGGCSLQQGCLSLISGGRNQGGRFLDASADGADLFFLTGDSLVPSDPGSIDAYDARIGGGLPEPQPPIPCNGDACQPLPSPPEDPGAGTAVPTAGNPALKYFKPHEKTKHHRHKKKHRRRGLR